MRVWHVDAGASAVTSQRLVLVNSHVMLSHGEHLLSVSSANFHFFFMISPFPLLKLPMTLLTFCVSYALQAQDASIERGKTVYMQVCFACHQPTGLGLPGMFPPLAGSDWTAAKKPDRMIRMVLHGVTGPVTINGKPFATPAPLMPPQGSVLSDQQIADVLTYVRDSFGNKASPVTPDQVKAIRDAEQARTAMWTEAELQKIPVE